MANTEKIELTKKQVLLIRALDQLYDFLKQAKDKQADIFLNPEKRATIEKLIPVLIKKAEAQGLGYDFEKFAVLFDLTAQYNKAVRSEAKYKMGRSARASKPASAQKWPSFSSVLRNLEEAEGWNEIEDKLVQVKEMRVDDRMQWLDLYYNKDKDQFFEKSATGLFKKSERFNAAAKAMGLFSLVGISVLAASFLFKLEAADQFIKQKPDTVAAMEVDQQLLRDFGIPAREAKGLHVFDIKTARLIAGFEEALQPNWHGVKAISDEAIVKALPPQADLSWKLARLSKRAETGDIHAQHQLAMSYIRGEASNQPDALKQAYQWFEMAALRGHANAQFNLGVMHQQGLYVPRDIKQAILWYNKAAKSNHGAAHFNLGLIWMGDEFGKPDYRRAISHFKSSYGEGVARSAFMIAQIYETGILNYGHSRPDLAMQWYKKAARSGVKKAEAAMDRLREQSKFVQN